MRLERALTHTPLPPSPSPTLIALFPANVRAAHEALTIGGQPATPLVARTIIQVLFLAAVLVAGFGLRPPAEPLDRKSSRSTPR